MKLLVLFLYEWKHFVRNPFKIVAVVLLAFVGFYGMSNGLSLYERQTAEINKIETKVEKGQAEMLSYYERGEKNLKDKPWVDLTQAHQAFRNTTVYQFKKPSPALVYSIGQAEQYGFYKRVELSSSPYDEDMAAELANPERLQVGTLDFAFVVLYLLPLLLLILLYNIKGAEAEGGSLKLIEVQANSSFGWLVARVSFYAFIVWMVLLGLIFCGALLTPVFAEASSAFLKMIFFTTAYMAFWVLIYFLIIRRGQSIIENTLLMVGFWLLFTFIVPGVVHQWVSISKPTTMMTEMIDAKREKKDKLWEEEPAVLQEQLNNLFPAITKSSIAQKEERKRIQAQKRSIVALANELMKSATQPIEKQNKDRNELIDFSFWFNPVSFFQNQLNRLSNTHYDDYQNYRQDIQQLIDKQIELMVLDTWNEVSVDKKRYQEYFYQ